MGNYTYHVSLHRIDSRWVIINRLVSVAGKIGFFSHRRLYYIVKPRTAEVFDMKLKEEQTLVYNWLIGRGYHVYDVSNDADWQAKDVDFLAFSADDVLKIAVKKDNWSGKADRLIVVMAPSKFLVIDLPTMQRYIETGKLSQDNRCGLSELISAGIAEICLI